MFRGVANGPAGQEISKIVVIGCHIFRLKCTKCDFSRGSAPDPAGGAHSASPDPLAVFEGGKERGQDKKR